MKFFTSISLTAAMAGAGLVALQGAWAESRSLSEMSSSSTVMGEVAQVEFGRVIPH